MNNELKYLIYNTQEEEVSVNVIVRNETIWLTQKAMAELFGVEVPAISKHLANIYSEGELQPEATISKMEIVQAEGNRNVKRISTTLMPLSRLATVSIHAKQLYSGFGKPKF